MNPQFPLLYLLPPLIGAFLCLGLMGVVLLKARHRPEARAFSLTLLTLALWQGFTFLMRNSPDPAQALFWDQFLGLSLFATQASFYYFVLRYTRAREPWGLGVALGIFMLAIALAPTHLVVQRMELRGYRWEPVWGPAFLLLVLGGTLVMFLALRRLWIVERATPTYEERNQLRYMLVGFLALVVGLGLDALFPFYPAGILGGLALGIATTVALLRFHLMDIRVALREALAGAITLMLLAIPFVSLTALLAWIMSASEATAMLFHLAMVAMGAWAVFLWHTIHKRVRRRFYGHRYQFVKNLQDFAQGPHFPASAQELATSLVWLATPAVGAEKVCLALPSCGGFSPQACSGGFGHSNLVLSRESTLVRWLESHNAPLRATEMEIQPQFRGLSNIEDSLVHQQGVELFIPLKYKGGLRGILLVGRRPSGEPYNGEDVTLLSQVADRMAAPLHGAQVYAEQKQMAEEMARLNRLRLDFIATLAHQFKTPLTALKAAAELLLQPQTEESRSRTISSLNRNFSRLEAMVQESLILAQIQAATIQLKLEPVNVWGAVEETVLALNPVTRSKGQAIAVKAAGALPPAYADRARLQDILFNLIGNAAKFSTQGARIEVSLYQREEELVVEIADEAPTLSPQEREKLFDPHHSVKRLGGGLGLAIAKGLVEQHNGKIWVNGCGEKGNTFGFSIPLTVDKGNGRRPE